MKRIFTGSIVALCTFILGAALVRLPSGEFNERHHPLSVTGLCGGAPYSYGRYETAGGILAFAFCQDFNTPEKAAKALRVASAHAEVLSRSAILKGERQHTGERVVVSFGGHYGVLWTVGPVYHRVDSLTLKSALEAEARVELN